MHIISEKVLNYDWAGNIVVITAVFLAVVVFMFALNKRDLWIAILSAAVVVNIGFMIGRTLTEKILPTDRKEYWVVFNDQADIEEILDHYEIISKTKYSYFFEGESKYIYIIRDKK